MEVDGEGDAGQKTREHREVELKEKPKQPNRDSKASTGRDQYGRRGFQSETVWSREREDRGK